MIARIFSEIYDILNLRNRWERLKFALRICLQDPSLYPLDSYPPFDVGLCERGFMRNHMLLHGYARTIGAEAITYLQPFNGFGSRPMSRSDVAALAHLRRRVTTEGISEEDAMHEFYRRVAADFKQRSGEGFYDLTAVFDQWRSDVYIDQAHCSDLGYDVIAQRIAEDILNRDGILPGTDIR
jgi:hypothetical protein